MTYRVTDPAGTEVFVLPAPVPATLSVQTSLVSIDLGSLDTSGFALGQYSIDVTVTDLGGVPIPGATKQTQLLIGSPLTAELTLGPQQLPPGTSTVTAALQLDGEVPVGGDLLTLVGLQSVAGARGVAARDDVSYVCGSNGISIIDYSDPENPAMMGTVGTGTHIGCQIQNDLLVALRAPFGQPFILDVYSIKNDPLSPALLGSSPAINYTNLPSGLEVTDTHAYLTQFQVCYVLGSNDVFVHQGDLFSIALNLDDPLDPTSAAPALDSILFDTFGDSTPGGPGDEDGCPLSGGDHNVFGVALPNPQTAYLASSSVVGGNTQAGVGQVQVVDVTDPTDPSVLTNLAIPGTVQAVGIGVEGNTGVVIGITTGWNDPFDGLRSGNLTVTTLDLSNPLEPSILAHRTLDRCSNVLDQHGESRQRTIRILKH